MESLSSAICDNHYPGFMRKTNSQGGLPDREEQSDDPLLYSLPVLYRGSGAQNRP